MANASTQQKFYKSPFFWLGLTLLIGYWYLVRPAGLARGYIEDFCADMSRRQMSENLLKFGKPTFTSDLYMAPFGMPVPFFSWSIERDWIGAYVWRWNKEFPFLWAYFAISLLSSYAIVGAVLRRMGFTQAISWCFATGVLLFHIPRHFKIWYHFEYLSQHWVYISLFLDAWIWQRYFRERRWSLNLELWRGFCLLGVLGSPGYFWGPVFLEWLILRSCLFYPFIRAYWSKTKAHAIKPILQIEWNLKRAILPLALSLCLLLIELQWFPPLIAEMSKLGTIAQGLGGGAHIGYLLRPLWLDPLWHFLELPWRLPPFDSPESVVTIGWLYWIPLILAVRSLRKRRSGPGMGAIQPFLIFLIAGIIYFATTKPYVVHKLIQFLVPFMKFFRVTSRWGQFLPATCAIIILLAWPELTSWFNRQKKRKPRAVWIWLGVFTALSAAEMSWLLLPVRMMPPLDPSTVSLLERVQKEKGTTVLDMPFCVAGGNGVCTDQQCPNYPTSTVGECFANWHEKKVYGLYQARLVPSQCQIYNSAPYTSWFEAWRAQRCLTESEWVDFCSYLNQHTELAAIFIYPEIWSAAATPECHAQIQKHLGPALDEGMFFSHTGMRGGVGANPIRIERYSTRCNQ